MPLSTALYTRLQAALSQCPECASHTTLYDFFGHPSLFAWQGALPESDSREKRVTALLNYLQDKHARDGQSALALLLDALRTARSTGDSAADLLARLAAETEDTLSARTEAQRLGDLLLHYDFEPQLTTVGSALTTRRLAAFLVHGRPSFGQRMLVERLLRAVPDITEWRTLRVTISSPAVGKNAEAWWGQLRRALDLPFTSTHDAIRTTLQKTLNSANVALLVHGVHAADPQQLTAWLAELWQRLLTPAKHTCLLFLIGEYETDCPALASTDACLAHVPVVWHADEALYPKVPLHLPPLAPFDAARLQAWLALPKPLAALAELDALTLVTETDGVPDNLYEAICSQLGYDFYEVLPFYDQ